MQLRTPVLRLSSATRPIAEQKREQHHAISSMAVKLQRLSVLDITEVKKTLHEHAASCVERESTPIMEQGNKTCNCRHHAAC